MQDRNNAFQTITSAVNAISTTERKRDQIKHKLHKMKSEVRKKQASVNQSFSKTGGGQEVPVKFKEWEKLLLSHLEKETIEGIDGGIDTATCNQSATLSNNERIDETVETVETVESDESLILITNDQENDNECTEKQPKATLSGCKKSKKRKIESPIESNAIIENQNRTIALLEEIAKNQAMMVESKKIELSLKMKNLIFKGIGVEDEDITLQSI